MKLRKIIKKYGDALIIRFSKDDISSYDIKEKQIYDIEFYEVNDVPAK